MDDMKEQLDRLWGDLNDLEKSMQVLEEENKRLRSAMPYPHVKSGTLRDAWDCLDKTTDVITGIATVLQILGYGEEARMVLQQKVNEKNRVKSEEM